MRAQARWSATLLLLGLLAIIPATSRSQAQSTPSPRPGRIWVRFRGVPRAELRRRAAGLGEGQLDALVAELNGAILKVGAGQETAVARRLAARADVAYALPIPEARALDIPNDPGYAQQWAPKTIAAPQAWDAITNTTPVTIAVVDTGVDMAHPDLASQLWTNPDEIAGNGIDDDGNGYVDDVHGWNLVAGTGDPTDDGGHGTHVAGIAAAATNNGLGVAGISRWARIMPVKVLDSSGAGGDDVVARGIIYAVDNGARIVNLSLGGPDPFPPLQEALAYALQHGVLVVAAAGNNGGAVLYPAAYPEAMAIAATDSSDQRASFSSYGPQVSVAAPGVSIYSTYPTSRGSYTSMSGTSMATPHVAGLAALVWACHPAYSPHQVRATIESTARDVNAATLPGRDDYLGYGRIDAARAVSTPLHWSYLPYVASGP